MTTIKDMRTAFHNDASTIPYFFRNNHDVALNLIIDSGKLAMLSCEALFGKRLNNELIQSVYDNIWNRLDLILDISHTYFNLYFDYIQELLQFYLTLAEQHELYDVCINIKKLQDLFDKPSADLFS